MWDDDNNNLLLLLLLLSRYSSVGIVLGYGLDDRGSRVRIPAGSWEFFSSLPRPEWLWGPPSPYRMSTRDSFSEDKAAGV
jgi:hypothetical protein